MSKCLSLQWLGWWRNDSKERNESLVTVTSTMKVLSSCSTMLSSDTTMRLQNAKKQWRIRFWFGTVTLLFAKAQLKPLDVVLAKKSINKRCHLKYPSSFSSLLDVRNVLVLTLTLISQGKIRSGHLLVVYVTHRLTVRLISRQCTPK